MAIDLLRVIFNFAIRERLVKANPCVGVKTGSSGTRETILDDAADYARLFQTLDRMEMERRIRAPVADAIRLIALTGCRRGEAAGLDGRMSICSTGGSSFRRLHTRPDARQESRAPSSCHRPRKPSSQDSRKVNRRTSYSLPPAAITRSPCRRHGARFAPRPSCPPTSGLMVSATA